MPPKRLVFITISYCCAAATPATSHSGGDGTAGSNVPFF